jgi:hypothetical protein
MMRNRWGIEIKPGYYAWAAGPRGGTVEGVISKIERTGEFARAYGPRVIFASGQSVGIDDISQVLAPMRVTKGGIVKANPTPRLKRADQPSQRARVTERGTTTKRASKRLQKRRIATHYEKTPGVWANPLTRVKVKSPSKATKAPPTKRLIDRRKVTQKAPPGFYANPISKALYIVWHTARDGIKHQMLATFTKLAAAKEYAQAYANAHDVSVAIETKKL